MFYKTVRDILGKAKAKEIMNYSPTRTATLFAVYLALCCASEDEESSPPSFTTVTTQSESPLDSESERVQRSQQHTRSSDTSTTNPFSFLSCNSYLRPFYPHYFTHCSCEYSAFSDWDISSLQHVPSYQCTSGYVVVETRRRQDVQGVCEDDIEERTAELSFNM